MDPSWLARGEQHLPDHDGWLAPAEVARAASMRYTKRRSEYLVARWAAKQAMARALGLPDDPAEMARLEVRPLLSGAPQPHLDGLPIDLPVAMTDRAGWAVCLVGAPEELPDGNGVVPAHDHVVAMDGGGIGRTGIDLELVEPRSSAFVADYFTPDEQELVAAAGTDEAAQVAANLLWSAKESALKVLRTGLRRDTRSVRVRLDAVPTATSAAAAWEPLTVSLAEGGTYPGWWRRLGQFLLTAVYDHPGPPPADLEQPVGLDTATPVHSWLHAPETGTATPKTAREWWAEQMGRPLPPS